MSHFTCDNGVKYFPFGQLDKIKLQQHLSGDGNTFGIKGCDDSIPIISFPLTSTISNGSCKGDIDDKDTHVVPVVLKDPDPVTSQRVRLDEIAQCYDDLVDVVIEGIFKIQIGAQLVSGMKILNNFICDALFDNSYPK